jgi:hypothetical protein
MELLGYVVESAAMPTPMQVARLRAFCRGAQQVLVDVCLEKAADADGPLLARPGGMRLAAAICRREVEGMAVLRLDQAFGTGPGLRPLRRALWSLGWPLWVANEGAVEEDPGGDGLWRAPVHSTPFGCLHIERRLFRHPWQWPQRELVVALRRLLGLDYAQIAAALRQLGLRDAQGGFAWPEPALGELVRQHAAVACVAVRATRDAQAWLDRSEPYPPAPWPLRELREPCPPYAPMPTTPGRGGWLHWLSLGWRRRRGLERAA